MCSSYHGVSRPEHLLYFWQSLCNIKLKKIYSTTANSLSYLQSVRFLPVVIRIGFFLSLALCEAHPLHSHLPFSAYESTLFLEQCVTALAFVLVRLVGFSSDGTP
jgi:hypothetical protein